MIEAIDLFCGAGGLTAGLQQAGIKVKAGYDIEEKCRYAFEFNNQTIFINKDVSLVGSGELRQWYSKGAIRLLAGCAPCQPFSKYNQGKNTTLDKKWPLLYSFARLIEEELPELVTMENVPEVTKHQVYHDFVKKLESLGYYTWADTVVCADYGVPQNRRRHVLLASRLGSIKLIEPTHKDNWVTVKDVIRELPKIRAGEQLESDLLHRCSSLNQVNLKRIKMSKPGGTWKDWPEDLRLVCHKKKSGSNYGSVYGRMEWDKPSPTMTTQCFGYGNGRFGHPEQDRAISLREAAIFQTFPKDYQFSHPDDNLRMRELGTMIGNAVPVRLGETIGLSLIKHLQDM
ncbi:DNA cytosine methyltransferase [Pasteurella atlantica]|uniref:DNA cytosine methyltransferase n=2 Tax=Pasteurellaceae TaxID=712 RepID=A0ACC6HJJ4_9PAST|nr:DNA cytosine methyltransferase [Pasteurella atlantica]MDP8051031.1 DNA cytosine methyltransferase [Pasteurella atlantica]MDP8104327.1 DNA cytosine methyltransferase [Pasteurella atlantica]MDP8147687.1 DNA cytosine methyltransferase [Pasteurella atlantica]